MRTLHETHSLPPFALPTTQSEPVAHDRFSHDPSNVRGLQLRTIEGQAQLGCWSPYPHLDRTTACSQGDAEAFAVDDGVFREDGLQRCQGSAVDWRQPSVTADALGGRDEGLDMPVTPEKIWRVLRS